MTDDSAERTTPIRVLLADDEPGIRAGLRLVLQHAEDIAVVAEAANGAEAVAEAARTPVDVALVDIRMPVLDGLAAIDQLIRLDPKPAVVMLTTFGEEENVTRALRSGASGFLLKDDGPHELISAVRAAAAGDAVLSPGVTGLVVKRMLEGDPADPEDPGTEAARRIAALAPPEREALALLGVGMPNLEIALRLGISPDSVKTVIDTILDRTGADTRVQAALLATRAGLTPETA
ncbi:DNA-binding NarL/FixJ family response regulator [Kitasatospora gansuensis]|uniref:DNA-binding NarL/FixJ family response regulator n=1 Tax=Kitasatospora gansuensis TaxID=258050 RepID=A0A7W7S9X4_9ACTN|nr:response regulator transcription factor [Kitasatospora gansuensis]MBB4946595.1 DNA-binding NarL/FixJ family response regulator [Kitasatospora gansuensis]